MRFNLNEAFEKFLDLTEIFCWLWLCCVGWILMLGSLALAIYGVMRLIL